MMRALRNWLAYRLVMALPIRQEMPRTLYRLELWLLPWAAAWAYRDEPL